MPVLEYAPGLHKMRQKRGLRRRSPRFLASNLNLIFIIAALGAAAQAPLRVNARIALCARAAELCLIARQSPMASISDLEVVCGPARRSRFLWSRRRGDDERSIRDHRHAGLAAYPAPPGGRLRGRACRLRAAVIRPAAAIRAGAVGGVTAASRRSPLPAQPFPARASPRSRLRLQACGREGHGSRGVFSPKS